MFNQSLFIFEIANNQMGDLNHDQRMIEEISSTHLVADSYYSDTEIARNSNRKTYLMHLY